jgi:hypothetical protein
MVCTSVPLFLLALSPYAHVTQDSPDPPTGMVRSSACCMAFRAERTQGSIPLCNACGGFAVRISFDLDDTLICYGGATPCEPRPRWLWRLLATGEPLRRDALQLMRSLLARGWELWVYTTSHRSPLSVRLWLWSYGIWLGGVVNQDVHDRRLRRSPNDYPPSKNPRAFGIDLHVDDSHGVRQEGELHGFQVVVVEPHDLAWAGKVLAIVEQMQTKQIRPSG